MTRWTGPAFALALFVCACGGNSDSTQPPPPPTPASLQLIQGREATDTIEAIIRPVIALVTDKSGSPVRGVRVRFSIPSSGGSNPTGYKLALVSDQVDAPLDEANLVTDDFGRARVAVYFGKIAGPDIMVATAGTLSDTGRYDVLPGQPAIMSVQPADTALQIGKSGTLRVSVTDSSGNPRKDTVTFASLDSSVAIDANGRFTSITAGRAALRISDGTMSVTTAVSVVPSGTIVAIRDSAGASVVTLALDGTNVQQVDATPNGTFPAGLPAWSPDGQQLVEANDALRVFAPGSTPQTLASTIGIIAHAPVWSPDGQWIYFAGASHLIWRVHPDGSGLDSLTRFTTADTAREDDWPSPSPDGTRLAFVSSRNGISNIYILNLATRVEQNTGLSGAPVRWAPSGETLAYLSPFGAVHVVQADGTGDHSLFSSSLLDLAFCWTSDGQWLVVRDNPILKLIRVSDGLVVPLPGTQRYSEPNWRPPSP